MDTQTITHVATSVYTRREIGQVSHSNGGMPVRRDPYGYLLHLTLLQHSRLVRVLPVITHTQYHINVITIQPTPEYP